MPACPEHTKLHSAGAGRQRTEEGREGGAWGHLREERRGLAGAEESPKDPATSAGWGGTPLSGDPHWLSDMAPACQDRRGRQSPDSDDRPEGGSLFPRLLQCWAGSGEPAPPQNPRAAGRLEPGPSHVAPTGPGSGAVCPLAWPAVGPGRHTLCLPSQEEQRVLGADSTGSRWEEAETLGPHPGVSRMGILHPTPPPGAVLNPPNPQAPSPQAPSPTESVLHGLKGTSDQRCCRPGSI